MNISFAYLRDTLIQTHREWSYATCVAAARYYLGIDTVDRLRSLVPDQADEIILSR